MFAWLWPFGSPTPEACPAPKPEVAPKENDLPAIRPLTPIKDIYYDYRPLFDLFGKSEGTDRKRGYNETLAYGAYTGSKADLDGDGITGDVELVKMTLAEVDALQTKMLSNKANKMNSSACGRYQIVRTTLRKIKKSMELGDDQLFDARMQDHMCLYLLNGRGLGKYLDGSMREDTFLTNLAKEWASIPTPSGKGFYGNQSKTPVTPNQVRKVLAEVKSRIKV